MSDADRFNIYTQIHKGLRACMAETLALVGRLDPQDPADVMDAVAAVRSLLEFCRDHLAHEEQWLHPALEAARPGASAVTRREHEQHLASLARLDALTGALANAGDGQRRTAALQLYQQLALFVAENFEHMHGEETANHATLVAHYSEQEIRARAGGALCRHAGQRAAGSGHRDARTRAAAPCLA
jgi:iron-sulfur cluster repair protein YtfE (RIC family)